MTTKSTKLEKEVIRATFRFHGAELDQIREVRDMLNFNSELDAARYLMRRGLEVMQPTLTSRRVQEKMASSISAESVVSAMLGADMEKNPEILKAIEEAAK